MSRLSLDEPYYRYWVDYVGDGDWGLIDRQHSPAPKVQIRCRSAFELEQILLAVQDGPGEQFIHRSDGFCLAVVLEARVLVHNGKA